MRWAEAHPMAYGGELGTAVPLLKPRSEDPARIRLDRADIGERADDSCETGAALIDVVAGNVVAVVDHGAAGARHMRLARAAVVSQWAEQRVQVERSCGQCRVRARDAHEIVGASDRDGGCRLDLGAVGALCRVVRAPP